MRLSNGAGLIVAVGFVLAWSGTSLGQELLSFTYSDLDGDFEASSQLFTVADDGDSDGEVTRLIDPIGDAFFAGAGDGFPGAAAFAISMHVTDIGTETAEVEPGHGAITLTDVDDDVFTASLEGTWYNIGGIAAGFVGLITGFAPDNTSGDGRFNGTDGSSILMTFGDQNPPFDGSIITLEFGNWFTDQDGKVHDFSDATTLTAGVVVPEPATLSLLALAGLAVLRRRRG